MRSRRSALATPLGQKSLLMGSIQFNRESKLLYVHVSTWNYNNYYSALQYSNYLLSPVIKFCWVFCCKGFNPIQLITKLTNYFLLYGSFVHMRAEKAMTSFSVFNGYLPLASELGRVWLLNWTVFWLNFSLEFWVF